MNIDTFKKLFLAQSKADQLSTLRKTESDKEKYLSLKNKHGESMRKELTALYEFVKHSAS